MTNANILIVEDEEEFSKTLERHLRRLNYAVLGVAKSGEEAQQLAAARRPDLVLSDVSILGGLDGFELAERLWRQLDVPVIFLTGHADPQTVERVQQAQSFGYLSKPFRAGELKAAIELALMRHATEQHHKQIERALLVAIRCAGDAVVMTDTAGMIQFLNPAAESLLELAAARAEGRPLTDVIRFGEREAVITHLLNSGGTGRFVHELNVATPAGREVAVELTISSIRDDVLGWAGSVVIMRDILERKRFEAQLERSRSDYRALAGHLESVREAERTRIAREIHDELGQMLTGFKYDLAWLEKQAREKPEIHERLTEMTGHLQQMMDTVRRITAELRPGVLDELGLVAAIEWQVRDFERRTGLAARFEQAAPEWRLDRAAATALFRVLQEALTNVARHAQALSVRVSLREQAGELVLEIQDDGRGVAPEELKRSGSFGLMGMRERIQALRGRCEIHGQPGQGTTVRVNVPVDAILAQEAEKHERVNRG